MQILKQNGETAVPHSNLTFISSWSYLTSEQAILATSQNRHAAILWLEWMASAESQKIADDQEPMGSSHLFHGGGVEQELRGKKLSWVNWEQHVNMESWMAKLFQAYGFPNAQR